MIDYQEINRLIYIDRTEENCKKALELLTEPAEGIKEALRYRCMRDAYHKLGDKDKVIEYGQLAGKYADQYFEGKKLLNEDVLNNQCQIVIDRLTHLGKYNIDIDAGVREKENYFDIVLVDDNYNVIENVTTPDLEKEIADKLNYSITGERHLYYSAAMHEIYSLFQTAIPKCLYNKLWGHG